MNQCKWCQLIYIVLIIAITESDAGSDDDNDDKEIDNLPSDFVQFVSGLDRMVFKKETKSSTTPQTTPLKQKKSARESNLRRSNDLRTTQNGALQDMLMMKLVSYYEDKYKIERNLLTSPRLPEVTKHFPRTRTRSYNSRRMHHPDDSPLFHDYGQVNDNWALTQNQNPEYMQNHNTLDQNLPVSPTVVEEVVVI